MNDDRREAKKLKQDEDGKSRRGAMPRPKKKEGENKNN